MREKIERYAIIKKGECLELRRASNGILVKFSDYEKLEKEVTKLRSLVREALYPTTSHGRKVAIRNWKSKHIGGDQ